MKYVVKTEEEWLELRKKYITASEAAVLVGADPYSSPAKIRKASEFTGNAYTDVGHLLEQTVVDVTNEALGTHFRLYETADGTKEFYTLGNLGATPDAHQDRQILLECKTVNKVAYLKYSAVPPSKYLIQLQVQLMTTELKEGYLTLMDTGMKTPVEYAAMTEVPKQKWNKTIFKVLTNNELCDILKAEAERFQEDKKFRVNSKVKKKVKLLLSTIYERVL